MAEDVKIYVTETVERVEIKVSDPFPANVLPTGTLEINDIKANTLSSVESGGSIPSEIYGWFKAKFTSLVDKLVSSWIHGLLFVTKAIDEALTSLQTTVSEHSTSLNEQGESIESLQTSLSGQAIDINLMDSRLDNLENNVIFETTLTNDAVQIDITGLNIPEGVPFKIMIKGAGYDSSYAMLRINGINTSSYHYSTSKIFSYFIVLTAITRYLNYFSFVLFGGNVIGNVTYSRDASGTVTGGIIQQSTFGLSLTSFTSISIIRIGTSVFTSGTKIKLVRA